MWRLSRHTQTCGEVEGGVDAVHSHDLPPRSGRRGAHLPCPRDRGGAAKTAQRSPGSGKGSGKRSGRRWRIGAYRRHILMHVSPSTEKPLTSSSRSGRLGLILKLRIGPRRLMSSCSLRRLSAEEAPHRRQSAVNLRPTGGLLSSVRCCPQQLQERQGHSIGRLSCNAAPDGDSRGVSGQDAHALALDNHPLDSCLTPADCRRARKSGLVQLECRPVRPGC